MSIELDVMKSASEIGLEVSIVNLDRFIWRSRVLDWILRFAKIVSPFDLRIIESDEKPLLLYCPYCGRDNAKRLGDGIWYPRCNHCGQQFMVRNYEVVKDPEPCENECHYCKPYGFVPEAGCPVHDNIVQATIKDCDDWKIGRFMDV